MLNRIRKKLFGASPLTSSNKRGTTFVSFETPLRQICDRFELSSILEFGPGHSTRLFLERTDAHITALESNDEWFARYCDEFDSERVAVKHCEVGTDLAGLGLGKDFDLVFVDGGDRLAALELARHAITASGIVYLHDAHREDYEGGIRRFPYVYFPERHSAILTTSEQTHRALKEAVPIDYSCACKYCSPPERRAYFEQFAEPAAS